MGGNIFISYRRGDDPGNTGRLFDRLQEAFTTNQLFMDVDSIAPGLDFLRVLEEQVAKCDVLLAVIGKGWIDARDPSGTRRLDSPDDFVRIEIESALNQGKRVIPILVGGAQMPAAAELPEAIKPLARRNAVRLTHERFRADTQGLIKALQQTLGDAESSRQVETEARRLAKAEQDKEQEQRRAEARAVEAANAKRAAEQRAKSAARQKLKTEPSRNRKPKLARYIAGAVIATAATASFFLLPFFFRQSADKPSLSTEHADQIVEKTRPSAALPFPPSGVSKVSTPRTVKTIRIPGTQVDLNDSAGPTSGGWMVLVTTQSSEEEAQASFRALQQRFPGVLSERQPVIRRVDLGSRGTVYRAELGPFSAPELADQFCNRLKAAGGQCTTMKNN